MSEGRKEGRKDVHTNERMNKLMTEWAGYTVIFGPDTTVICALDC